MYVMISPIYREGGWAMIHGIHTFSPYTLDTNEAGKIYFDASNRFTPLSFLNDGHIVFYSDANQGAALAVSGYTTDGGGGVESINVTGFWSPEITKQYFILSFTGQSNVWQQSDRVYDVSRFVESVSFESNINGGFTTASVQMAETRSDALRIFSRSSGFAIRIFLKTGEKAWEGIISGTEISGYGGVINAVGYATTNDWFLASGTYVPGVARDGTTYQIVSDALSINPYFDEDHFGRMDVGYALNNQLDANGDYDPINVDQIDPFYQSQWMTQKSGGAGFQGWGPFDFDENPVTISEAISLVTRYGDQPYVRSDALIPDDMYFQVYFDQTPLLTRVPRDPAIYDDSAPWYLDESNFEFGYSGVNVQTSYEDIRNIRRASYTESDGETTNTQAYVRWPHILWHGPTQESISSSTLTSGEIFLTMSYQTQEKPSIVTPGSIRVTGSAKRGNGAIKRPVALIRAGDVVFIQLKNTDLFIQENELSVGPRFIVGATRYDSESDSTEITMYSKANIIERQIAILDVVDI